MSIARSIGARPWQQVCQFHCNSNVFRLTAYFIVFGLRCEQKVFLVARAPAFLVLPTSIFSATHSLAAEDRKKMTLHTSKYMDAYLNEAGADKGLLSTSILVICFFVFGFFRFFCILGDWDFERFDISI
jgi:hypothetical protein